MILPGFSWIVKYPAGWPCCDIMDDGAEFCGNIEAQYTLPGEIINSSIYGDRRRMDADIKIWKQIKRLKGD